MKDLSLHILDIAQNSVAAGARHIGIVYAEEGELLTLTITDDGAGMEPELLARVSEPFITTRDTRPVGMGLPLLRFAAELTGGDFHITSSPGRGTTVSARFYRNHIDAIPAGDLAESVAAIIQGAPGIELSWSRQKDAAGYSLDTGALRSVLGPVSLNAPEVFLWIRDYIAEQEALLRHETGRLGNEKP